MAFRPALFASVASLCIAVACSGSQTTSSWSNGDDAGSSSGGDGGSSSDGSGGSSSSSGGTSSSGSGSGSGSSSGSGGSGSGGAVSCSSPSTGWAMNGSACGTWRWAVKTGTDDDVGQIDLTPQVTTIAALRALPTSAGGYCSRTTIEATTYELKDVHLKFEHLEADSDYHVIASDASGNTMIVEVPYPGCVGHDACKGVSTTPLLCDITHARAAVDAKNPGATSYADLGTGTVIGVGFFDTDELMNSPQPTGMAPNGIELHPVLAICFGQGCNPLQGY